MKKNWIVKSISGGVHMQCRAWDGTLPIKSWWMGEEEGVA